jgi:hypothetical protein
MSDAQNDERYGLQAENRHLREMIVALRDEMEKMRIGEQERLQKALAAANDEAGQLKNTVMALRDELDRRQIESEERGRAVEQATRDEVRQLHEMIRSLREKLEAHAKGQS